MERYSSDGTSRTVTTPPPLPDYSQWLRKEAWSVTEAAKLLCGRDPHAKLPGPQVWNRSLRVIDIIDRAFESAQSGGIKVVRNALLPVHLLVEPPSFLHWAVGHGMVIPEPLGGLLRRQEPERKMLSAAIRKDRVMTIARTLWCLDPALSATQVAYHPAMRSQVPDDEVSMSDRLGWIDEARSPGL